MARIEHRRVMLRLYDGERRHQEILSWLSGYTGRRLQNLLSDALLIGLRQILSEPFTPAQVAMPQAKPEPAQVAVTETATAVPSFVPSPVDKSILNGRYTLEEAEQAKREMETWMQETEEGRAATAEHELKWNKNMGGDPSKLGAVRRALGDVLGEDEL